MDDLDRLKKEFMKKQAFRFWWYVYRPYFRCLNLCYKILDIFVPAILPGKEEET